MPSKATKNSGSLSIIFPAYNEERNIGRTIREAFSFAKKNFSSFEIIVVNDGSTDKTREICEKIARERRQVKIINNPKNLGYGATVWKGLKAAKKDLIFFSDADRQFDLREISRLLEQMNRFDVVIGYRKSRKDPFLRKSNAFLWKTVIRCVLNLKVYDVDCAFKLFKKEVIDRLRVKSTGATFSAELLYQIKKRGFSLLEVPVTHFPRLEGKPTGAKPAVIIRALGELWRFYLSEKALVKAKSIYAYTVGIIILFLTRILFMSNSSDFFDANEYLWRTTDSDLLRAISTGHAPYHPLYVFFSNLLYNHHIVSSGISALVWPSVIFGTLSVVVLFIILKKLFSSRVAWIACIFYALLPFVWISQITALIDPTEHFFFYLSILFIILALKKKRAGFVIFSVLSGLSLALAALAHTQVGFWVLAYPGIIFLIKPRLNRENIYRILFGALLVVVFAGISILIYAKLLLIGEALTPLGIHTFKDAINFLFFDNISDKSPFSVFAAISRLDILSTTLLALCAFGGAIMLLRKDYLKLIGVFIWIFPAVSSASYMYENLYGRTGILALAPISLLGAIFILNIKRWSTPVFFVVLAQILIISLPAVILYKTLPAPNESLAKAQQESEPGGVFISSNVTRTWNAYDGHFVNFGDVGVGAGEVYRAAQEAIQNGREAYISSDAIYFPFWRYDGKYFDLRSRNIGKSSDHQSLLYELFTRLNVTLERTSDKFKQSIYSVSSSEQTDKYQRLALAAKVKPIIFGRIMSSDMPVQNLTVNLYNKTFCQREREDITRNDLLLCLMRELTSSKSASNFTPTDRDGWFYMANELKNPTLEIVPDGVNTRSGNSQALFAAPVFQKISSSDSQLFDNLDSLKEAISRIDGSFYVIAQTSGDEVVYQLFKFNYILPKTNLLEAEKMSGEIGDIARSKGVSNFQVRTNNVGSGFMISGPYINLPAGKYTIGFSLKSGKIIDPNSTVNFDVVSAASGESFASVGKNASDFQNGFTLQNINFELLNETSSLEFRVRTEGKAEVLVDYLVLNHF